MIYQTSDKAERGPGGRQPPGPRLVVLLLLLGPLPEPVGPGPPGLDRGRDPDRDLDPGPAGVRDRGHHQAPGPVHVLDQATAPVLAGHYRPPPVQVRSE